MTHLDDLADSHTWESEVVGTTTYHDDEDNNPDLRLDEDRDTDFTLRHNT